MIAINLSPELLNYPQFGTKIFKEEDALLAFALEKARPDLLIAIEADGGEDLLEVRDGKILRSLNSYSMDEFLLHPKIVGCLDRLRNDYLQV